jgi:hypothetical protein
MRTLGRLRLLVIASCAACYGAVPTPPQNSPPVPRAAKTYDYPAICAAIAAEIEELGREYSQLAAYDANSARSDCTISYDYHTHDPPRGRGGWAGSVPEPDPDGIWFHIGVWDPRSSEATMQINTQPALPPWWIGDRRVTFLVLEGEQVKPVAAALVAILKRHGMTQE